MSGLYWRKQVEHKMHECVRNDTTTVGLERTRERAEGICRPEAQGPFQGLELTAVSRAMQVRTSRPMALRQKAERSTEGSRSLPRKAEGLHWKSGDDVQAEGKDWSCSEEQTSSALPPSLSYHPRHEPP